MKFIFPQNYSFKNKFLGIIDYSSLIFIISWGLIVFLFVHSLIENINVKIFTFIIFFLPILLFSIIGFNHENIIYIFFYIFKYFKNNKLYLYSKNNK